MLTAVLAAAQQAGPQKPQRQTMAPADTDEQRIADLVIANHILFDLGVLDGFGHVSVRSVKNPSHFFLSQSKAPGMVTKDDIMELDENSEPVSGQHGRPSVERFIHGEIYRLRPDVQAVVHSHNQAVIPFGVTKIPLRPIIHTAGFLPPVTPVFEIRTVAGEDNSMLIVNNRIGAGLAKVLDNAPVVLMRGHGDAVVASNVRDVVYRAVYTQMNAQVQAEALKLGEPVYLNPMEAAKVDVMNRAAIFKSWDLWVAHVNADAACRK
jgi:HCOMODA/2-hydroxy-3-carboxy-muconic semialdehyde decarboxylase